MTILELEKRALDRWYKGDPYGWAEISDTNITAINPDVLKPIIGLEDYRAYLQRFEGIQRTPAEMLHPLIQTHGDVAVLSYHEAPTPDSAGWNVTSVYFQSGGTWKRVHAHGGYLHHRAPDVVDVPVPVYAAGYGYEGVLGELMAIETGAMIRWRKGDPWGFIEISDSSVTYMDTGTPQRIDGIEALSAEYASRAGKIFYDVNEFIDPKVQVCGDSAVLFYRFFSTVLDAGGSIAERTPWYCTEVFTRVNGQWKIFHTQWSLIRGVPIKG
ncbi:MAG TPA: nuclear transport factor 2 family protein [Aggregatilineaceae bacterium]|nr:nuclear transport factor 2 family protein [Aggregatilineaceae bacterium]